MTDGEVDDIAYDDDDPYGLRAVEAEKNAMQASKAAAAAQVAVVAGKAAMQGYKAGSAVPVAPVAEAQLSGPAAEEMETWTIRAQIEGTSEGLPAAIMKPDDSILNLRRWYMQGRGAEQGCGAIGLVFEKDTLKVKLYDTQTLMGCGLYHGATVLARELPPRLVATASVDGTCKIWETSTGSLKQTLSHEEALTCVAFNDTGDTALTASKDTTAKIWIVETGECKTTLKGHKSLIQSAEFCFAGDGERVATACDDDTAKVWNAITGKCLWTMKGHKHFVRVVKWSPDSNYVLTASYDSTAKLWYPASKELLQTFEGHTSMLRSAAFAPGHGEWAITSSSDGTCRVWDVFGNYGGGCLMTLEGHNGTVFSSNFTPDGRKVLTASIDCTAKLWNVLNGECELTLTGHSAMVLFCTIAPTGLAITVSADWTARIWNLENGECLQKLTGHAGGLISAAFSVDGESVVTTSDDHTAKLWSTSSGACLRTIAGHSRQVCCAVFSPW